MTDKRTRGIFKAWRERAGGETSRRQADYAWVVLARVLSFGTVLRTRCRQSMRSVAGASIAARVQRRFRAPADEAAFLARAPAHLHLPLLLALWTGQRQGDLLRLPWSAYDGNQIRLRQSKGGRPLS